jgi:hypothetical protein
MYKMNSHVAISNLTLPDVCIDIIKSYVYVDKITYQTKLIRKSIHLLLKNAINSYNDEIDGYYTYEHTWLFRWFPNIRRQFQTKFCLKCGNYIEITFGKLSESCECKCI